MIKRLRRIGNSFGILIDRPILDLLGVGPGAAFQITTDGKALHMTPVKEEHAAKVERAARRMTKIHSKTLKRLAD
jgi:antitoxin component of MazEF toxin-antitoxin module